MCFNFFFVIFTDKLGAIFCEFRHIYSINRINYNKLRTAAVSINWNELTHINGSNIALNNLIDKIKICLSKAEYIPKKLTNLTT